MRRKRLLYGFGILILSIMIVGCKKTENEQNLNNGQENAAEQQIDDENQEEADSEFDEDQTDGESKESEDEVKDLVKSVYEDSDFDTSGEVTLELVDVNYDIDSVTITYVITNHSDTELTYGADAGIEKLIDGEWYQIPWDENVAWIGIAYILSPGASKSDTLSLDLLEDKIEDGTYRLIKQIGEKMYFVEFVVSESGITEETPFEFLPLDELSQDYTADMAVADGAVFIDQDGTIDNEEQIDKFIKNVGSSLSAWMRVARYTVEGDLILTDYIYNQDGNGYFLIREDATRDNYGVQEVTEQIRSFLITDGDELYFSNCRDWETVTKLNKQEENIALLAGCETKEQVEQIEDFMQSQQLASSICYQVFSQDGSRQGSLTEESLEYSYDNGTISEIRVVNNPDERVVSTNNIEWVTDTEFVVTCSTNSEEDYFEVFNTESRTVVQQEYGTQFNYDN